MDGRQGIDVHEARIPHRDIDADGRMRASAYVDHAETALAHFWRHRPMGEAEPDFHTARVSMRLLSPLRLDEVVQLVVTVEKIGGKSVGFSIAVERDGETAAEIELVRNAVDRETGEPAVLPEDLRDWLYGFLG